MKKILLIVLALTAICAVSSARHFGRPVIRIDCDSEAPR